MAYKLLEENEPIRNQREQIPEEDSTLGYIGRNLLEIPYTTFATLRSGLGIGGELANLAARKTNAPESVRKGIRALLPTYQEALEQLEPTRPSFFPKRRPEDETTQQILQLLAPGLGVGNALRSGPSALKAGVGLAGSLAGGTLGRELGGEIGESLGDREIGETLGRLGGGLIGSNVARRPSKILPQEVHAKESVAFEKGKSGRLAEAQKEFKNNPIKQAVVQTKNEIKDYNNKIKQLDESRAPLYENAKKLEGNSKGNAQALKLAVDEVYSELGKGVSPSDSKSIRGNLESLLDAVNPKGELSLADAKKLQKNFNDQIYDKSATNSFKRQMTSVTSKLNDFIRSNGSEEHNKNWQQAEQATRELKALKKGHKEFNSLKNQELKELNKDLSALQGSQKQLIKSIGKETYEDLLKSKEKQKNIADTLIEAGKGLASNYGLGGLGYALSHFAFGKSHIGGALVGVGAQLAKGAYKEFKIARDVMKSHPEIFDKYAKLIANQTKENLPQTILALNQLGSEIEELSPQESQEEEPKYRLLD